MAIKLGLLTSVMYDDDATLPYTWLLNTPKKLFLFFNKYKKDSPYFYIQHIVPLVWGKFCDNTKIIYKTFYSSSTIEYDNEMYKTMMCSSLIYLCHDK